MKLKLLLLVIAVVLIFAMPFMALARMSSISDADLNDVKGQTGVVIDLKFHVEDSYISVTDSDGYDLAGLRNQGALSMTGFTVDSNGAGGDLTLIGLKINAGSLGAAGPGYVAIGLPAFNGYITCNSFKIGSEPNMGGGLGSIVIGDLVTTNNSVIKLTPY